MVSRSSSITKCAIIGILSLSNLFIIVWHYTQSNVAVSNIAPINGISTHQLEAYHGGLGIPRGVAIALPSLRTTNEEEGNITRKKYLGIGDKPHLGGFTEFDGHGVAPKVWKDMVQYMGIRSVIDVGCGRGTSTSWFLLHGLETACVEGSHDAIEKSIVPNKESVYTEHDFSRGPWWPAKTYDAVWSVEFLEHVGRNFQQNYIPVFQSAAIIIATSSTWGGWHHVEVHNDKWWIARMQSYGFVYSEDLTTRVRKTADRVNPLKGLNFPEGNNFNAQHVWLSAKVFINPAVASLPKHQHLLSEPGCFHQKIKNGRGEWITRPCSSDRGETELPDGYLPLTLTDEMDEKWYELVRKKIPLNAD